MPSLKDIRDRIRSVGNTAKITGAMQLIAASKMQRAQELVREGRPYADRMAIVVGHLAQQLSATDTAPDPLFRVNNNPRKLIVLVTPDRGLAGALVSNIARVTANELRTPGREVETIAVGRKGERFVARAGGHLHATFSVPDRPSIPDTFPISSMIIDRYRRGEVGEVVLVYAQFVNTTVQRPIARHLLPVKPDLVEDIDVAVPMNPSDYIYEPTAAEVISALAPRYVETLVFHAVLEAQASEHSARMVAMQAATDNANELIEELTLDLNKARQESITGELLDIVGGVAAVEQ